MLALLIFIYLAVGFVIAAFGEGKDWWRIEEGPMPVAVMLLWPMLVVGVLIAATAVGTWKPISGAYRAIAGAAKGDEQS